MKILEFSPRMGDACFWSDDFPAKTEGANTTIARLPATMLFHANPSVALQYWYYTGPRYCHALSGFDFTGSQSGYLDVIAVIDPDLRQTIPTTFTYEPVYSGLIPEYAIGISAAIHEFFVDPDRTPMGQMVFNRCGHCEVSTSQYHFKRATFALLSLVFGNAEFSEIDKILL